MSECETIWGLLDVAGWHPVLYFETSPGTCDPAPPGTAWDDPRVVRREQWIVAGEQYIYENGGLPLLGEYGDEPAGCRADAEVDLPQLIQLARLRMARGYEGCTHPVLRDLVEKQNRVERPALPRAVEFTVALDPHTGEELYSVRAPPDRILPGALAATSALAPPPPPHRGPLLELYGRLMIQSVLPCWNPAAASAFRLAADMCLAVADGREFDEQGSGLPDPVGVAPGPWGAPALKLRENYDSIVSREKRPQVAKERPRIGLFRGEVAMGPGFDKPLMGEGK